MNRSKTPDESPFQAELREQQKMNIVKNDPGFMDRRSGRDRRSGNDRRSQTFTQNHPYAKNLRCGFERRKLDEDRAGWVRISIYSSADIGLPVDEL
ncbi:MAG: hypothetical protein ACLFNS_00660 [Desulfobacterales bacterium]